MKKIVLIAFIALMSTHSFAQKKKGGSKKKATTSVTASGGSSYAKFENLSAEVKGGNFQVAITDKGNPIGAIVIKPADANFRPLDAKISTFRTSGVQLYILTWVEKSVTKTDIKSEEIASNYTSIFDVASKKLVFSNIETNNHIVEKVFLDKNKNASETQEKIRREGFQFILNPDGSIIQKNKSAENHLVYDATKMEFVNKKK